MLHGRRVAGQRGAQPLAPGRWALARHPCGRCARRDDRRRTPRSRPRGPATPAPGVGLAPPKRPWGGLTRVRWWTYRPCRYKQRRKPMSVAAFEPKFMKVGVLTAALQELTPREKRDPDPDLAVEEWAAFAREVGADYIQLSAALHPSEADVPAEALLDPVANTLDLREPFSRGRGPSGCRRRSTPTGVGLVGPRLLRRHAPRGPGDPEEEARLHAARLRCGGAARRPTRSAASWAGTRASRWRQNLEDFEESFVPLLKEAKERGLTSTGSSSARCPAGPPATTSTTTSPTPRAPGSRCTASARSTGSATSSASTTTPPTRSSWARTPARSSST